MQAETETNSCCQTGPIKTRFRWLIGLFSLIALSSSAYLAWSTLKIGKVVGCGNDGVFDCGHVLQSKWSSFAGVPVSLPAAALHVSLLFLLILTAFPVARSVRRKADNGILLLTLCAAAAAIWFIGLQVIVIKKLCQYCLVAHTGGLLACVTAVIATRLDWKRIVKPALFAIGMTTVLAVGQYFGPTPQSAEIVTYDEMDETEFESLDMEMELVEFEPGSLELEGESAAIVSDAAIQDQRLPRHEGLVTTSFETPNTEIPEASPSPQPNEDDEAALAIASEVPASTPASEQNDGLVGQQNQSTSSDYSDIDTQGNQVSPDVHVDEQIESAPVESDSALESVDRVDLIPTPTPIPEPQDKTETSASPRRVKFPGAKTLLKVNQWPMIGDMSADVVVAELFDYTCPHCREMNRQLEAARDRFGEQFSVVLLPVPLNSTCNASVKQDHPKHQDACELAYLAMSVWLIDRDAFEQFHCWLCEPEEGRTAAEARLYADQLVGADKIRKLMSGSTIGKYVASHVQIYKKAGEGVLPKIFTEKITVNGKTESTEALCRSLSDSHGIKERR